MKRDIDWEEIAKVEIRLGAPERPAEAVKAVARHAPMPQAKAPAKKPKPL
jgi:hypothetical protein